MSEKTAVRLSSEERRESIIDAATVVFGERGYHGATTDAIATAAGISQAYVVRMFGSKEELFIATGGRAVSRIIDAFAAAIATFTPDTPLLERKAALSVAYNDLVTDRGMLLTLMHFYELGHDPVLGPLAREQYLKVYRMLREDAGFPADDAIAFFAHGMLINVMLALGIPSIADEDPTALELLSCSIEGKEKQLIAIAKSHGQLAAGRRG